MSRSSSNGESDFEAGELVLAMHHGHLYKAKVKNVGLRPRDKKAGGPKVTKYLVHYNGWRASYDEWVTSERLKKFTEENLELQRHIVQEQERAREEAEAAIEAEKEAALAAKQAAKQAARAAKEAEREAARQKREALRREKQHKKEPARLPKHAETKATKRARDAEPPSLSKRVKPTGLQLTEGPISPAPAAKKPLARGIRLPESLQQVLIDDCVAVTKQKQLVPLPRKPSVNAILARFVKTIGGGEVDSAEEFRVGVIEVFCHSLGPLLLYSFERAQYADLLERHKARELAAIYGAEHLLRLLLKFPDLFKFAAEGCPDKQQLATHKALLARFIEYLHTNRVELFKPVYENCTPAYLRLSALAGV